MSSTDSDSNQKPGPVCNGRLFDTDGPDEDVSCDGLASVRLDNTRLLWIDLLDPDAALLDAVWAARHLPEQALHSVKSSGTTPSVMKEASHFWIRVVAVSANGGLALNGELLTLVAGENVVVSIHAQPVSFLDELRKREADGSDIGILSSDSFVAALLDWQLSTYFDAASGFEMAVERLEVDIFSEARRDCLPELQRLRKVASRLRRMLAPHRGVFNALSRPDFQPTEGEKEHDHFQMLNARFERAMDTVENARELIVGSFELFTSQTALKTNDSMRILTFVTVVAGVLAVIAGSLGMNFDAAFFKTKDLGFWIAAGGMLCISGVAVWIGKHRKWL